MMPEALSPLSAALRSLRPTRSSLVSRASEAADSGLWLALRVEAGVDPRHLEVLLAQLQDAHLLPITSVAASHSCLRSLVHWSDRVHFWAQWTGEPDGVAPLLPAPLVPAPLVPAPSRDAEPFCDGFRGAAIAIDEFVPGDFAGACFAARAERDKAFVRCAKGAFRGVADGRIDRVSLWTATQRVQGACRSAARSAQLSAATDYEFCVPYERRSIADRLLREGETVRVWFAIDETRLRRAVAR